MHDRETIRFARAVLSRPYIFTIAFIIVNIFIFFLTSQAGADRNPSVLINYGAKYNQLINEHGEWWRFITPIFLHGNIVHLLMNMYGLWVIGPYVERLYGSAKFVIFWVVSGIAGVVASYLSVQPALHNSGGLGRFLFKAHDAVSVGASGALFGLIGVLFVFGLKFRRELPEGFKRAFGTGMLPTILINIFIGYAIPVIDNAAHMGGLLMGGLLALVVGYKRPGERGPVAVFWHVLQFAALALVITSFVMVARHFNKPYTDFVDVPPPSILDSSAGINTFVDAINNGQRTILTTLGKGETDKIDEAIKALETAPPPDKASSELRDELKSLLARARDVTALPSKGRAQQRAKLQQMQSLYSDFEAWNKKFNQWVKTEGKNYGIIIQEPPPADGSTDGK
jgi:membrane associated rhomboid family serine protease